MTTIENNILIGQIIAFFYIRVIFGTKHKTGNKPKYFAFNINCKYFPLKMVSGSLYFLDYRIHHWLFYLLFLPIFLIYQYYIFVGFSSIMILHGFTYKDWLQFKYN